MHLALDLRDGLRQRLITSPRLALIAGWAYTPFGARLRTRAGMRPHGAGVGEPAIWSGSRDTVLAALNSSGWCPNGGAPVWAANKAEWAEAAQFFARVIAADTSYISHGEMQTGLSLDGKTWAPGLEQRFLAGLGSFDGTRGLAIVRGACGKIVAPANVTWCFETADAPFATLQDMAVEPALRMAGLGARLLRFVGGEALRRGAKWIFLESGKNNRRAHAFFERQGFTEVSHVYVRPCTPELRNVMPGQEATAANEQEGA